LSKPHFLVGGIAIFVWDGGMLFKARASRDWPHVEGQIKHSAVRFSRDRSTPDVVYGYTVSGTPYSSKQISFDLFDKPGGQGRTATIVHRYPEGEKVTVYYDPSHPATAILEPEVYSPFLMPLIFAGIFSLSGSYILWIAFRRLAGRPSTPPTVERRRAIVTVALSLLMYIIVQFAALDSSVQERFVDAFGKRPGGIPVALLVFAVQTVLFLPMPWVFWHVAAIGVQAVQDRRHLGVVYLLTVGRMHPHLWRSQLICLAGLIYAIAIGGVWIVFAAIRGI
jgi:uncharacterized protein DUF3592